MELQEALTQITEIRLQMARTEVFRGYRALPAAFSGVLAGIATAIQALVIIEPSQHCGAYLTLWIGAALVSGTSAVLEMVIRARHSRSPFTRELTALAMEQFFPCLAAGGLLTVVIVQSAPASVWMLPGLWQVLYGLGIFATCRLLPRSMSAVAVFYTLSGLVTLTLAQGEWALSPLAMGIPFGVGQLLAAAVLHRALERNHDAA